MAFDRIRRKREAVNRAEADGQISDTLAIRRDLIQKINRHELTLNQAKVELRRIKREGKKKGLITWAQAYSRG